MHIKHITIHELVKERNSTEADLRFSPSPLTPDDKAVELAANLDNIFVQAQNVLYAEFDRTGGELFPEQFDFYRQDGSAGEFMAFTRESLQVLRDSIENIRTAKGGYFVFVDYNERSRHYFGVFLVRNATGMIFRQEEEGGVFSIDPAVHIDIDRLAMACRIDIDKYNAGIDDYLSFTRNARLKDISDYFVQWLAADTGNAANNKSYTEAMTVMIDNMPCPVDPLTGEILERDDFKEQVVSYARNLPDKTLNMAEFSREFYDDENFVQNYARKEQLDVGTEFKPDIRLLKRSNTIDAQGDGIRLSFPLNLVRNLIHFDEHNPNRIVIDSKYLAEQVRRQVGKL